MRLLFVLIVVAAGATAQPAPQWSWAQVPRVVAIGDVHGTVDKLESILTGLGLVDAKMDWAGGTDHLVFCGDLIDRGPADRAVMDLVLKLQSQAEAAGGRVHVPLGNHDVMNLIRDLRYVSQESYAEFAPDESAQDRERGWRGFRAAEKSSGLSAEELKKAFDLAYPPGYFARIAAFKSSGRYGHWLLEQPAVVRINGVVFLHGGLTAEVAELGLDRINRQFRSSLSSVVSSLDILESRARQPADFQAIYDTAGWLAEPPRGGPATDPRSRSAARGVS